MTNQMNGPASGIKMRIERRKLSVSVQPNGRPMMGKKTFVSVRKMLVRNMSWYLMDGNILYVYVMLTSAVPFDTYLPFG